MFLSCGSDDSPTNSITRQLEFAIDNERNTFINNQFYANENCNEIFISVSTVSLELDSKFLLEISLNKKGNINSFSFVDYSDDNRLYRTADFNPSQTFLIENFKLDEQLNSLYFEFEGTLYEIDTPENTKRISGAVTVEDFQSIDCSFTPKELDVVINQELFSKTNVVGLSSENEFRWIAFSDNDIKLELVTDKDLSDLSTGVYSFARGDITNIVSIEKYIGQPKATHIKLLKDEDWKSYEYEGELIISKQIDGIDPITNGSFNFKVFEGNELVYEITNGSFSL